VVLNRPGHNSAGQPTSHAESLVLTQRVRLPYPDQASLDASRVALSDYVYATDSIVGAAANMSAETSPKPVAAWTLPGGRVVGNTLRLELVAFHRNGRNREQVACVEFRATDGTSTVTQVVGTSTILGHPGDRHAVVGYACDLDISALANGTITANARVMPWIGGAASVLDSADKTALWDFSPRAYRKNPILAANPVYVYVAPSGGSDSSGAVSTDPVVAAASPCATVHGATLRAATVNGEVDGVIVRLMAGTHVYDTTNSTIRTQNGGELIITRDPATTRAAVNLQIMPVASVWAPRLGPAGGWLTFRDITVTRMQGQNIRSSGAGGPRLRLWFDACDYNNGGFSASFFATGNDDVCAYWTGTTIINGAASFFNATTTGGHYLWRGVDVSASSISGFEGRLVLGSRIAGLGSNGFTRATTRPASGSIIAFNRLTAPVLADSPAEANLNGYAFVQNIVECTSTVSAPMFRLSSDSSSTNSSHVIIQHNTFTGFSEVGRANLFYDDGPTARTNRLMSLVGNIWSQINTKGDVFRGANESGADASNRTGNWAFLYGVGCRAEFSQFRAAGGSSFEQAFPGLAANMGNSQTVRNDPLFLDYEGTGAGPLAGAGGGDYRLQAGSPALGRVNVPVLRFDLAGQPRAASGDASGALAG
jgi:hypothetical protein